MQRVGRPLAGWVSIDAMVSVQDAIEHYTRQIELSRPEWAYWMRGVMFQEKAQWQMAINDFTAAIEVRRNCLNPAVADDLRYYRGLDEAFSRRAHCQVQALALKRYSEADCQNPNATLARLPALYGHWIAASLRCRPVTLERWSLSYVIHIQPAMPTANCDTPAKDSQALKASEEKCACSDNVPHPAVPEAAAIAPPAKAPENPQPEKVQAPAAEEPKANYFDMRIYAVSMAGLPKTGITSEVLNRAHRCEIPLSIYSPVELEQAAAHFDRLACVDPVQLCRQALRIKPDFAESHLTLALLLQWPSLLDQPLDAERFEEALHETDMAIAVREDYADALRWRAMLLLRQSYGKCKQESRPFIELAKTSAMQSCEALGFTGSSGLQVLAAVLARGEDYSQAVRRQRLAASLASDDAARDWLAYYCWRNASDGKKSLTCCPQRNP